MKQKFVCFELMLYLRFKLKPNETPIRDPDLPGIKNALTGIFNFPDLKVFPRAIANPEPILKSPRLSKRFILSAPSGASPKIKSPLVSMYPFPTRDINTFGPNANSKPFLLLRIPESMVILGMILPWSSPVIIGINSNKA